MLSVLKWVVIAMAVVGVVYMTASGFVVKVGVGNGGADVGFSAGFRFLLPTSGPNINDSI